MYIHTEYPLNYYVRIYDIIFYLCIPINRKKIIATAINFLIRYQRYLFIFVFRIMKFDGIQLIHNYILSYYNYVHQLSVTMH